MNILQINASQRAENSQSSRLATAIVERIRASQPDASVKVRDLGRTPHPALDESALGALFTPADKRSPVQNELVDLDEYRNTPADTQMPYLKTFLGFIGMTDVQFIYAEDLAMGPEAEQKALASAQTQIEEVLPA